MESRILSSAVSSAAAMLADLVAAGDARTLGEIPFASAPGHVAHPAHRPDDPPDHGGGDQPEHQQRQQEHGRLQRSARCSRRLPLGVRRDDRRVDLLVDGFQLVVDAWLRSATSGSRSRTAD